MIESTKIRLDRARENQNNYRPNEVITHKMRNVTFVALIGISGIGKSHLIPFIIKEDGATFSELSNISTRANRPSDPDSFRGGRSHEELLDQIERHELVSYVVHPSGDIYASDIESYSTPFVILPTLTSALAQLEALACFKQIVPIGLVVDDTTWKSRFKDKLTDPKLSARLEEALVCLRWLKTHVSDVPILDNQTGAEAIAAKNIVAILQGGMFTTQKTSVASTLIYLEQAVQKQQQLLTDSSKKS